MERYEHMETYAGALPEETFAPEITPDIFAIAEANGKSAISTTVEKTVSTEEPLKVTREQIDLMQNFLSIGYENSEVKPTDLPQLDLAYITVNLPAVLLSQRNRFKQQFQTHLELQIKRLSKYLEGKTFAEIAAEEGKSRQGVYTTRGNFSRYIAKSFPDINELVELSHEASNKPVELVQANNTPVQLRSASSPSNPKQQQKTVRVGSKFDKPVEIAELPKIGDGDEDTPFIFPAKLIAEDRLVDRAALRSSPSLCRILLRTIDRAKLREEERTAIEKVYLTKEAVDDKKMQKKADRAVEKLYRKLGQSGYYLPEKYEK